MELNFKEWMLLKEDGFDGGSEWDLIYPTRAGDYSRASARPRSHWWLQWQWKQGEILGRKLINIDGDEFQKRGYTTITSRTMPDDKPWNHRDDGSEADTEVKSIPSLIRTGIGKDIHNPEILSQRVDSHGMGKTLVSADYDLDAVFGDEKEIRTPHIDLKYIDRDWVGK